MESRKVTVLSEELAVCPLLVYLRCCQAAEQRGVPVDVLSTRPCVRGTEGGKGSEQQWCLSVSQRIPARVRRAGTECAWAGGGRVGWTLQCCQRFCLSRL